VRDRSLRRQVSASTHDGSLARHGMGRKAEFRGVSGDGLTRSVALIRWSARDDPERSPDECRDETGHGGAACHEYHGNPVGNA
jgi:hypothetical protein